MSETQTLPWRERVSYQGMLLGGFALVATLLLVLGNLATRDAIDQRMREDLRASLAQVIPAHVHDNDLLQAPLQFEMADGQRRTIYRGTREARVTALAWEIVGQGYAGDIRLIIGLDANGEVLGIRVLSHAETPGLGDKIEASRDDWILAFTGLSLENTPLADWFVKKDGGRFDAFSGATITPRGVLAAIREGLQFFREHRTTLVDTPVVLTPQVDQ